MQTDNVTRRKVFGLMAATAALTAIPTIGIAGCSTSWIGTAEKDLPIIINIAETVVSIAASLTGNPALTPAAIVVIQEAAAAFSAALKTLSDAIAAYKAAPQDSALLNKVISALNAVEQDAPAIIKAIAEAPGGLISVVTSAIGIAISLISAIEALLPAGVATGNQVAVAGPKRVAVSGVKLPDAQVLKSNFNATLSVYGYGQFLVK